MGMMLYILVKRSCTCHCITRFQNVDKRLAGAVLQHDVDVLIVFKVFEELDNVPVLEAAVKLNLTRDLFLVVRLGDP